MPSRRWMTGSSRRISPGGSADLLALTYLLHFITTEGNNDE